MVCALRGEERTVRNKKGVVVCLSVFLSVCLSVCMYVYRCVLTGAYSSKQPVASIIRAAFHTSELLLEE